MVRARGGDVVREEAEGVRGVCRERERWAEALWGGEGFDARGSLTGRKFVHGRGQLLVAYSATAAAGAVVETSAIMMGGMSSIADV